MQRGTRDMSATVGQFGMLRREATVCAIRRTDCLRRSAAALV